MKLCLYSGKQDQSQPIFVLLKNVVSTKRRDPSLKNLSPCKKLFFQFLQDLRSSKKNTFQFSLKTNFHSKIEEETIHQQKGSQVRSYNLYSFFLIFFENPDLINRYAAIFDIIF
jgi:hypothetical protein